MTVVLFVLAAGAVGSATRGLLGFRLNHTFPTGTFVANLTACFLLGLSSRWDGAAGTAIRVGLLGSLSTWSSFAFEVTTMWRLGRRPVAAAYLAAAMLLGIGFAWLGLQ